MLATALKASTTKYLPEGLIRKVLSNSPFSETLVQCLTTLSEELPHLLPDIQSKLLESIQFLLATKQPSFSTSEKSRHSSIKSSIFKSKPEYANIRSEILQDSNTEGTLALALRTLWTFNFEPRKLTQYCKDYVLSYLDDDNPVIQKEAAITCTKLTVRDNDSPKEDKSSLVSEIVDKLLIVGISDTEVEIRTTVLTSVTLQI
jgi:FKBP12-rapamycin complex-associated protein